LASGLPGRLQDLGNLISRAQVHFIRRLAGKGRVPQSRIVFLHVKTNELFQSTDGVERIQVEPLMFECSLPRFD
jgi:hypothetical protein